jgi:hypothetical protein
MAVRTKILKWALRLAAFLVLSIISLLLIAPPVLNIDYVRQELQTLVAEQTGAQLDYQKVGIVYTPLPTLSINQLNLILPDAITIQTNRVLLSLSLKQLVSAQSFINHLQIDKPVVHLYLAETAEPDPDPVTEAELWSIYAQIRETLINFAADLEIELTDGTFELIGEKDFPLTTRGMDVKLILEAAPDSLNVKLSGQLPDVALKSDATTRLKIDDLELSAHLEREKIKVELDHLLLARPKLDFHGDFTVTQTTPKLNLTLGTQVPDLIKVLPFLQPFLADIEGVDQVFDSILGGAISNISVQSEANNFTELFGSKNTKLDAQVEDGEFYLSRLNHHLRNISGQVQLTNRRLELWNTYFESGRSYATTDKIVFYRKRKNEPFMLEVKNSRLHLSLAGLHRNLLHIPTAEKAMQEISAISGQIDANLIELHGPLADMGAWEIRADGSISKAVISTQKFPAPITVHSGTYSLEHRNFTFNNIEIQALDTELKVSGFVHGQLPEPEHIQAQAEGEISTRAYDWLRKQSKIPDIVLLNTPLTINHSTFNWKKGDDISAEVGFSILDGPEAHAEVAYTPHENMHVVIAMVHNTSDARFTVDTGKNRASLTFTGELYQDTLHKVFVGDQRGLGHIKGDFGIELKHNRGVNISTSGKLSGENLLIPIGIREPLIITELKVAGQGESLDIDQFNFGFGDKLFDLTGSITSLDGQHELDLALKTGPLDLILLKERIAAIQNELSEKKTDNAPTSSAGNNDRKQPLPLRGEINLDVESLSFGHLTITPVRGDIQFKPGEVTAQVNEAALCGVDMPASALITHDTITLQLLVGATNQDLQKRTACLSGEASIITGRYDISGQFNAQMRRTEFARKPEEIINKIDGEFAFHAWDGAIEQSPMVSQLLNVINLSEAYNLGYLSLDKNTLGYKTFHTEGKFANGRVTVAHHFDGVTLDAAGEGYVNLLPADINIDLLLAPLKTANKVVKWLPGINYLLAGNLVTIPIRLTGPPKDMKINVIPASAVSKQLLGIAERLLKLPVKIVEPLTGTDPGQLNMKQEEPKTPKD